MIANMSKEGKHISMDTFCLLYTSKLTAEYGRIGGNLNQIARTLNEWHSPYPQLAGEVRCLLYTSRCV